MWTRQPNDLSTIATLIAIAPLFVSCATLTEPAGPAPTMRIGAVLKYVEPLSETPVTQTRGGLTLTLAPVSFDTVTVSGCTYRRAERRFLEVVPEGVSAESHTLLEEVRFPALRVQPDELAFLLTIRNQMEHVFRGDNAVVDFAVDRKVQAVEQSNYLEFLNALIPPGREVQLRIGGPSLKALADSGIIAVALHNVVTETDKAGNVARRESFEWFYEVRHEVARRTLKTVEARDRIWVPKRQANAVMASPGLPSALPAAVVSPDGKVLRASTVKACISR